MRYLLNFLFCLSLGMFSAQTVLDDFAIDLNQNKVLLAWTIKSGSLCNGIQIYRSSSEDSSSFELIKDIQGVCGDLSTSVAYTHTDQNPFQNQVNYYKLLLGQEYSQTLGIEVLSIPSNSYLLRPNPILSSSELYFENSNNYSFQLKIYDDFGSVVHEQETNGNRFIIDSTMISSGLYYFTLENNQNRSVINGKALFID